MKVVLLGIFSGCVPGMSDLTVRHTIMLLKHDCQGWPAGGVDELEPSVDKGRGVRRNIRGEFPKGESGN